MIYESHLINLVKHYLILEFKERGAEAMCINEFLPLCVALLLPYKDEIILRDAKCNGSIIPIINTINKCSKIKKEQLHLSLEGLRSYYKEEWLPTLEFNNQKELIKNISLITNVENNGYFSIKGNEKVFNFYLKQADFPDISQNYGNDDYSLSETNNQEDEEPNAENNKKETISLSALKDWLLKNFPMNKYPNGIKQFQYFWQYKLSQEQYGDLKSILLDLNLKSNKSLLRVKPCGEEYGSVAKSVALFISEWYKRECTSLGGNLCLEELNLDSGDSFSIWAAADLSLSYLHLEDVNDQKRRQTAMCTLGGLPLYFVVEEKPERFRNFVNGLFKLKKNEDITYEDIESIVDCFDDKNQLFKRSLKSGSCKEYLIKLVDYLESGNTEDLPFAESDMGNSPFSDFIKRLQDGYDNALPKNFFQTEIRIWTSDYLEDGDDSNLIESEFYVHIGFLKSNNVITTRELSKLGIALPPETSMFDTRLKITMKDGSFNINDEKRTYHKIGNHCDDFCGAFGSSLATSIDFYNTRDIALLIECGNYCKEIPLYTIPSYLELYVTDNGFLWTTKTNNSAQKVLFYDKYIYTPQNEEELDILTKSYKERNWGWIYQTEAIDLVDCTGKVTTIGLGKSELIMVDFKVKSLRKVIELSKDGCVECLFQGDDNKEIPLLYFDDRNRPLFACDGMKGNDLLRNYKIEFKQISDNNYSEWTTDSVPPQGFLSIRISCRDESKKKKQRKIEVYLIPGTYPIVKRNLNDKYIYIKGENVCVQDESLKNNLSQIDGKFNYRYKDSCDNLESSIIPFQIGDKENHIIIKVYRAFSWTQILNKNKKIKDITNDGSEKPPIALILQKNIHLKVVNKEGYNDYSPCFQRYFNYFRDPMRLSFVKQGKSISGFYINEVSLPYLYCVYISSFDDNGKNRKIEKKKDEIGNEFILLNVSEDYINEYPLCYWSGDLKDDPVKLELKDPNVKPYHFDIPSPLSNKAVVFQSLRDCTPNLYFRPFYQDVKWENYVQRYDIVTIEYIIKCYQLAVEYNVHFCIFPATRNLQKRTVLTEFIRKYAILKNFLFSDKEMECLTRLVKELAMDWFFVDRNALYRGLDEDSKHKFKKCLRELLRRSPISQHDRAYSIEFIDNWFLANNIAFNQKNGSLPRKFLKALDKFKDHNYDGCDKIENRISLLNQLITTPDNIFQEICKILNN